MAVKIQSQSFHFSPEAVCIYLEDLEQIIQIINLKPDPDGIEFSDAEYKYASLDEIRQLRGNVIRTIEIGRPASTVDICLGGTYPHLTCRDAEIFVKIKDILESRRRPLNRFFEGVDIIHSFLVGTLAAALVVVLAGYYTAKVTSDIVQFAGNIFVLSGILPFALKVMVFDSKRYTRIFLSYKHQNKSFWQRHKEGLLIDFVKMVIGGLIGGVIGWFLRARLK